MKTREQILTECPEEFHERLFDWIEEVEQLVNLAMNQLGGIKSIGDLGQVEEVHKDLIELSRTLY
jgi:hypothetical protein